MQNAMDTSYQGDNSQFLQLYMPQENAQKENSGMSLTCIRHTNCTTTAQGSDEGYTSNEILNTKRSIIGKIQLRIDTKFIKKSFFNYV